MSSDRTDPEPENQPDAPISGSGSDSPDGSRLPGGARVPDGSVGTTVPVGNAENGRGVIPGMLPDKRETVISKPVHDAPSESRGVLAEHARTPQELGASLEGSMLGHFQLEQFVGGGGMGAVFRGVDTMLGRTVAVKVLSRDRTDPETLRRFKNEAQSAARLDNENIARVYFVGEDRGLHYIVFEFIEGVNVRDLVEQEGPLSLADAISFTLQVAEALDHATQRNVVHRDIKPSNVLVAADGRAKLVDMGLARLHQVETDSKDLTASGVTLGTFDYISPEQARDPRAADVRSDLYSLGCTFYFMLTGRPPFPEGTVLQKLLSHSGEDPTDPRNFRPNLDEQVVQVLNKLLAKQPGQRYQQPNELIGELLLIVERLNLTGVARSGKVWLSPQPWFARVERSLPWIVPGLLLIGILAVLEFSWPDASGESAMNRLPDLGAPPARAVEEFREEAGVESPPPVSTSVSPVSPSPVSPAADASSADAPSAGGVLSAAGRGGDGGTAEDASTEVPDGSVDGEMTDVTEATAGSIGESSGPDTSNSPAISGDPATPRAEGDGQIAPQPETVEAPVEPTGSEDGPATVEPGIAFNRVVVAPEPIDAPEGALVVSNLDTACRLAASSKLRTIELRFDGVVEERALDIGARNLFIRNAAGFEPTIAFRPSFEDLIGDRRMIRVAEGQLTWQGIDVALELPAESAEGWALFALDNGASLAVEDSVLTIRNVDSRGALLQRRVSFVELLGSPAVASRWQAAPVALPVAPTISFERSLLRGQAVGLRAEQAMPFRLIGNQSLIVSSERLVDVAGARQEPSIQEDPIDVVLNNVTAVLGKGIARLSSTPESPYQQDLVTAGKDNIVLLTGADAALIEFRGVAGPEAIEKRLFLRGRDNFYVNAAALLRINPDGDPSNYLDFGFENREAVVVPGGKPPVQCALEGASQFRLVRGPAHTSGLSAG